MTEPQQPDDALDEMTRRTIRFVLRWVSGLTDEQLITADTNTRGLEKVIHDEVVRRFGDIDQPGESEED